jgi:glycine hydroxymethyltransferase
MANCDDFQFHGTLAEIDPAVAELIACEAERQTRKLIMIPSESDAADAVLEAQGSVFQNVYAEGYPDPITLGQDQSWILNYDQELTHYRRRGSPRYYMGVEYANMVEALARRRCAELFANDRASAEQIFVNVQPLSGAPANNAVYEALLQIGDTVMGMSLVHGGHLTHGSPVNRSGKHYHIVPYEVDPEIERLDYDQIAKLAAQNKPRMIIAGYTSYPHAPDWKRFRAIADSVGAYLMADISHVAGMVTAGVFPSPVGYADVVTFTTHKTLCGPRAACILTTREELAKSIDRAVFPGEQGGPHVNTIAAMAVAFKLATTDKFVALQKQILANAQHLARCLQQEGLRIPYGGTESHMLLVDCKSVKGRDGAPLMGDPAARILDLVGIVVNRNTIPGDSNALHASGIRLGTPWITQRGLREPEVELIAKAIADTLKTCQPYSDGAKVDFDVLEQSKLEVQELIAKVGLCTPPTARGYPHFWTINDPYPSKPVTFEIIGRRALTFMQHVTTNELVRLAPGGEQATFLLERDGGVMSPAVLNRPGEARDRYLLVVPGEKAARVAAWLRALSDGYVAFDDDLRAKLVGPMIVREAKQPCPIKTPLPFSLQANPEAVDKTKLYFIGQHALGPAEHYTPLPIFAWKEPQDAPPKRTTLYETHKAAGARIIPFAGWEMPVWYTSVIKEHQACRKAAALFDATHMGVLEVSGPDAHRFLDLVQPNDISTIQIGQSLYSYFLDVDGDCMDDTMIYQRGPDRYMVVVNASNNDKDWAWLNAIAQDRVMIDRERPWIHWHGDVTIRDLRDRKWGDECRVDLPLQGPRSRDILLTLAETKEFAAQIKQLKRAELCEGKLAGHDVIVSRTGYTGEPLSFEIFVHPDRAPDLWNKIMAAGAPFGLKPTGLGARDSLRTEAGLPLYGHELAGPLDLTPDDAGFGAFAKLYKPFFIGRSAFIGHKLEMKGQVVRFRVNEKNVRMPKQLDLVADKHNKVVGKVLSCAIDTEGFFTGQAFVENKYTEEGTPLWVAGVPERESEDKPRSQMTFGDRVMGLEAITIVSRMPKHKKVGHERS